MALVWRPGISLGEKLIRILFSFEDSRTKNVGATSKGFCECEREMKREEEERREKKKKEERRRKKKEEERRKKKEEERRRRKNNISNFTLVPTKPSNKKITAKRNKTTYVHLHGHGRRADVAVVHSKN
jgi:hypothetical protein